MLCHEEMLTVYDAAAGAGLADGQHRAALTAHLGALKYHLQDVKHPLDRLMLDLNTLSGWHEQPWAFAGWLEAAVRLAAPHPAHVAVFEWALRRLGRVPAARGPGRRHHVLFLAANPLGDTRLQVGEEFRAIDFALRAGAEVTLRPWFEPRWSDLALALNQERPTIVHFSGHGSPGVGLHLARAPGEPAAADGDLLAGLLRSTPGAPLDLVVLNACETHAVAAAIGGAARHVVGVRGRVPDDAALSFSRALYGAIAGGRDIHDAFGQARAVVAGSHPGHEARYEMRPGP